LKGFPLLIYAITPVYVGMGRSSGIVDLPIQRDPLGFPIIFSSSFKGALKQWCGIKSDNSKDKSNKYDKYGRLNCNNQEIKNCCCLFGGESIGSDENAEANNEKKQVQETASIISLSDFYPLVIPVPSLDKGYVYLTSKYLIDTLFELFSSVEYENGKNWINQFNKNNNPNGSVTIGSDMEGIPYLKFQDSNFEKEITNLGKLAERLKDGIAYETDDLKAVFEIEKGIIKYTRNKINLENGTVSDNALWTEEYLPRGTILAGIVFFNVPRKNKYCENGEIIDENKAESKFKEVFGEKEFYLNVGGKETIGRGLVKVKVLYTDKR